MPLLLSALARLIKGFLKQPIKRLNNAHKKAMSNLMAFFTAALFMGIGHNLCAQCYALNAMVKTLCGHNALPWQWSARYQIPV